MTPQFEPLECRVLLSTARLAVIGDYGVDNSNELAVANMVKGWNNASPLTAILTTGDNDQYNGDAYDRYVGKYYHQFVYNYHGSYGGGSATQRFLPTLGNHDWGTYPSRHKAAPYLSFFTLPGKERYFEYVLGPVHVFMIDSDPNEPDGTSSTSTQANWLKSRLAASTSPWNLVFFHHPAYSSSSLGAATGMRWPFKTWGADAVFSGHHHIYERLNVDGLPYFINGPGGANLASFGSISPYSQKRYNASQGAQLIEASDTALTIRFINKSGTEIDRYTLTLGSSSSTLTFQQGLAGYSGTIDTFLRQASPTTSYASASILNIDGDEPSGSGYDTHALLRFENLFGTSAGQIPTSASITSATLQLQLTNGGNSLSLYRMLKSWSASATWSSFVGGIQTDNIEASSSLDASTGTVGVGTVSIDVTAALRAWQANPSSNFGWAILPTGSNGVDFYSSQGATAPKLIVRYTAATNPNNTAALAFNDSFPLDEDPILNIANPGLVCDALDASMFSLTYAADPWGKTPITVRAALFIRLVDTSRANNDPTRDIVSIDNLFLRY